MQRTTPPPAPLTARAWLEHLAGQPEWLVLPGQDVAAAVAGAAVATAPDRAAVIEFAHGDRVGPERLWRRDYLRQIVEYGLAEGADDAAALVARAADQPYVHRYLVSPPALPAARLVEPAAARGTVLLISLFGAEKFGGAEHFLEQMARLYQGLGYDPLIVGLRGGRTGETGAVNGLRHAFVAPTPAALFRLAWRERACIAHVVSGLGQEVAAALRFLRTRLVFGIHFWRELFEPNTANPAYYPDCPANHVPRRSMPLLLTDADAVYANSAFTRAVVEDRFGTRLNVIPSLRDEVGPEPRPPMEERPVVLLPNSRFDKGFGLLLALAARLPELRFAAIASQSSRDAAEAARAAAGLGNVTILDRRDDMGELYRQARVVLVPSYRFVETFSRVVMEAQRHGVPVIGSDRGNIPYLLRDGGVSLPEDERLWAEEVHRLFHDEPYWQARSAAALGNAAAHGFAEQAGRLSRLVDGLSGRVLVGVGSGLGNIVHTTPLIRVLSRHLGQRVDVVAAADSPASLAVVANPEHVGHAFLLHDVPLRRHYDTVFLTNRFGALRPAFRAGRVVRSREWDTFHPGHALHEAEFNLASMRHLLGVPYGPDDVGRSFVAGLRPRPGTPDLVGLHAGSKTGTWSAKRWPHFAALAARLRGAGLRVASFGSADEHVPGTIDRTGGTVEEMAAGLQACGAFVSNDSGVMNIANALDIPLVAIFAPTEARTRGPLGPRSVSVVLAKDCAPCELAGGGGPFAKHRCRCIAEIPVEAVGAAVERLLRSAGAREAPVPERRAAAGGRP